MASEITIRHSLEAVHDDESIKSERQRARDFVPKALLDVFLKAKRQSEDLKRIEVCSHIKISD